MMASSASSSLTCVRDHLRLERHVHVACSRFSISSFHSFMPFWAVSRKSGPSSAGAAAAAPRSIALAVAGQADVDRVAQADARRVEVDLDGLGLAGLGIELHVGEAAAGDEQRVALLHRLLGRSVPSRPMPPVVYGQSSGTTALPSSGLTIGPPTFSASCTSSSRGTQGAPAGEDDDLLAGVDARRRPPAAVRLRERRVGGVAALALCSAMFVAGAPRRPTPSIPGCPWGCRCARRRGAPGPCGWPRPPRCGRGPAP